MDLDLRTSFLGATSRAEPGLESTGGDPNPGSAPQKPEAVLPDTLLRLFPSGNNSLAGQELQQLYQAFHLWLQPEQHSKEEMICQVVLEQFMLNRHHSDRSALKMQWEASGKNLERFLEGLSNDTVQPPALVHVRMQGQEALFSENMPLREVIAHLTRQRSAGALGGASLGRGRGRDDGEGGAGQGGDTPSLAIVHEHVWPAPEGGGASSGDALSSRRAGLGPAGPQGGSPRAPPSPAAPVERRVLPEGAPSPRDGEGGSPRGARQGAPGPHRCDECPKAFRYLSRLRAHERRHRDERPFACGACGKGFFGRAELRAHQRAHAGVRPFQCGACGRAFGHKTNLLAHERIHTGAKPYACGLCQRRYRQSGTFHRHLRTHRAAAPAPEPCPGAPSAPPGREVQRRSPTPASATPGQPVWKQNILEVDKF